MIRLPVCALMAAARLLELRFSRRNMRATGAATEGTWSHRTYPLIVALHTAVVAGTMLRGSHKPHLVWLAALIGVQPFRAWVLFLLGARWNTRAAVPLAALRPASADHRPPERQPRRLLRRRGNRRTPLPCPALLLRQLPAFDESPRPLGRHGGLVAGPLPDLPCPGAAIGYVRDDGQLHGRRGAR